MALSRAKIIFFVLGLVLIAGLISNQSTPNLKLEIADSEDEMRQGLSDRSSLDQNAGMLFVYPIDTIPSFWMKNMNFPIDIIWLDQDKQIVGWEKGIEPSTYPTTFSPPQPIRYVLEVNAGFVDKHNLKVGEKAYN